MSVGKCLSERKWSETAVGLEEGVGLSTGRRCSLNRSLSHLPTDMELIPLELMHSSRDAIRKAREAYLIDWGQTLEPKGINRREEM